MSTRSFKFTELLISCSKRQVDINTLGLEQIECLVEVCHNIANNPKVLLTELELRSLKRAGSKILVIAKTRQAEKARTLLKELKANELASIARVGLNYAAKPQV